MVMDYAETIFRTGNELLAMLDNRKEEPFREKLRVGSAATLSRNFQLHFLRPVIEDTTVEVVIQSAALPPPVVVADEIAAGWLVEVARIDDLFESFYAITADRRYPNPHVKKLLQRGQDLF